MSEPRRAPWLYRAVLTISWPARVRVSAGRDLESMFVHCLDRARRDGRGTLAHAWLRGLADVVSAGIVSHWHEARERRRELERRAVMKKTLRELAADIGRDIVFAVRTLTRERLFTVTALATIAICLAGNAAVFSVVRSVLLKPLPIPDANRIVLFANIYPKAAPPTITPDGSGASAPDYYDRAAAMTTVDLIAMYQRLNMAVDLPGGAQRASVVRATPSFFSLLHSTPIRGRTLTEADAEVGANSKVLLSHGYWQRELGSDSSIVGRDVRVNGVAYTVVGILPRSFQYLWENIDLWMPLAFTPAQRSDDGRHSNNWNMIARMKSGVTVEQVQRDVDAINARQRDRFPALRTLLDNAGFRTTVLPLQDVVVRDIRSTLYLLWGGAILVLLVGGVNLANLFMVRSSGRVREMAIRHAIGGRAARLARQLLTETIFLMIAGGIAGIAGGWWLLRSAASLRLDLLPRGHEITLDWISVAVMILFAAIVGVAASLTPIAQLTRSNVSDALRDGGRGGSSGVAPSRLRASLATAQIAFAFVLLVGAGLLVSSFRAILKIDTGFEQSHLMTASVNLPAARYADNAAVAAGTERILTALRQSPGVTAAGVTTTIPFGDTFNSSVVFPEGFQAKPGESLIAPLRINISDGYLETMRIPVLRGRAFDARDNEQSHPVAIVDERLAQRFWPGQEAVGKRIYLPTGSTANLSAITPQTQLIDVVGVARNVPLTGLTPRDPLVGAYYFPQAQLAVRTLTIVVRTTADPASLIPVMRKAVMSVDPQLPLYGAQTMDQRLDRSLVPHRLPMILALAFGAVALFLAAVGIYGVLAYRVAQRRREIGIRLALGGSTGDVIALIMRDGIRITIAGLILGGASLFALTRAISSLLYGVSPFDATVIFIVAATLAGVALLATLLPARRATRIAPAEILAD